MNTPPGDAGAGNTPDPLSQAEPQQTTETTEHLRLELQMVETERVRLSLLEEKLVDVLQILQRLRDLVGLQGVPKGRGIQSELGDPEEGDGEKGQGESIGDPRVTLWSQGRLGG